MALFIDPLTDFGFKRIFANENHKNITISFLNSILQLEKPIIEIEFQNLEKVGETKEEKKSIFDIFAKDQDGKEIIVELQRADQTYFIDRSLYYVSKQITDMGVVGKWDYHLKPIYFIAILDFVHFEEFDKYIQYISLKNRDCIEMYKKLKFIFIELPKFQKDISELKENEKWIYFLKNLPKVENREILPTSEFQDAFEIAYYSNLQGEEKINYEIDLKERRDKFAIKQTRKMELVQAEKQGLKRGERKKQIEIAKGMLQKHLEISLISELTGLIKEEIQKL